MNGKLENRVAIITGGGRGIGRASALLFAREGARVVVATRTAEPGEEVVKLIEEQGGEAMLVTLDVGGREDVRELVARTVERFGRIDVVLHNAAYIVHAPLGSLPDDKLDKVFDVGLKAAFWLMSDALPWLEQSPAGRFLVTSSLAGNRRSYVNQVHYGALKAGVNGFIRGAGLELARKGITVNGIEPGLTQTHALETVATDEAIARMAAKIPIPRPGEPLEMAHGLLFLASDEAAYITGQTIVIDGGTTLGDPGGLAIDRV